ncbi:MAG: InlB B-repeat-containing protein [Paludibacteraceae bacterium]|nr:InlB B-repeat-containing protein [Paludibacteraceae bacterium]
MKTFTTCAEKKAKQILNLLQGYTKGIRITAILILLLMGVSNAWADAYIKGASIYYETENGATWWDVEGTTKELGTISTFNLKGFWVKIEPNGGDVCQNTKMHYEIKGTSISGNYNITNPNDWNASPRYFETRDMNVDVLSGLNGGTYTIEFWFEGHGNNNCASIWYSNNSNNYKMTFTYSPVVDMYLAGDGWCGNSWSTTSDNTKMTNNGDGTYTKTISDVDVSNHQFKISAYNWGQPQYDAGEYDASGSQNVYSYSGNDGDNFTFKPVMQGAVTITLNTSTGKFTVKCATPLITFDQEGGTGGTSTQSVPYGTTTSAITIPTKTGYTFGGYYTGDNGTGTQIIGTDGKWIKNKTNFTDANNQWIVTSNKTLYAKWTATKYTITYNDLYGVTHSNPVTYTIESETITFAAPTSQRTGYTFTGWNPTKIEKGSTGDKTVTAQWTEITYAVTISAGDNGSVNPSGTQQVGASGLSVTATANTGYKFKNWTVTDGAQVTDANSATTTITATADGTVTANFSAITYTINYNLDGGTNHAGNPTNYTIETPTITLKDPTKTGYTFNGWYSEAGFTNKVTQIATGSTGDKTLYAKWTEITSTVTVTTANTAYGTLKFDSTPKDWGTTASVGVSTSQPITATANEGYKFVQWELSGSATSTSTLTDATITLKSDGTGTAGTATAVFEEDLNSSWHLVGDDDNVFPAGWNVNDNSMMKKRSGSSSEKKVYMTITVSNIKTYEFKVVDDNGNGSDKWYGYSNDRYLTWTETSEKTVYQSTDYENKNNLKFTPNAVGNYVFKVDYSGTYPEVTITYPELGGQSIYLYGEFNDWQANEEYKFDEDANGLYILEREFTKRERFEAQNTPQAKYEFKLNINGTNYTVEGNGNEKVLQYTRQNTTKVVNDGTSYQGPYYNLLLQADITGKYIFTYDPKTQKLTVTHPKYDPEASYIVGDFSDGNEGTDAMPKDGGEGKDWTETYGQELEDGVGCIELGKNSNWNFKIKINGIWYGADIDAITTSGTYTLDDEYADTGEKNVTINTTNEEGCYYFEYTLNGDGTLSVLIIFPNDRRIVTFEMQGHGTQVDPQHVLYNQTAVKPYVSDVKGYLFGGWYTDANCTAGTEYDFTKPVTQDITLYAKWIPYGDCIFYKNNLNWDEVYVYFYSSDKYWTDDKGTGANMDSRFPMDSDHRPHYRKFRGKMTRIGLTDIWYFDYISAAKRIDPTNWEQIKDHTDNADNDINYSNIAFTAHEQYDHSFFDNTKVIRRGDFNRDMQLFIPQTDQTPDYLNQHDGKSAKYYNKGLWMKYNDIYSGYDWSGKTADTDWGDTQLTADIAEEYSFVAEVYLNVGKNYEFKIKNLNDDWYGNNGTMTAENCTNWHFETGKNNATITPTVTGYYTFTVYLGDGKVMVSLEYPLVPGDYRLAYQDNTAGSFHPGHYIKKRNKNQNDTVSFFIHHDKEPQVIVQVCTDIDVNGNETWATIDEIKVNPAAGITETGVYNFTLQQIADESTPRLLSQHSPYTGDYYIRTYAANGGWRTFRHKDNLMTYSSYADVNDDFDHYFCKWVDQEKGMKNVSYTVANNYSYCISDTLLEDIDPGHPLIVTNAEGDLPEGKSANVRFGWDSKTNKLRRAYIAGSGHKKDRFLVLEGNEHLADINGNRYTGQTAEGQDRYNLTDDEVVLDDMGNWIYQMDVQANKDTRIQLTARYDERVQYFKGTETESVALLASTAGTNYKIRLIYDFKTNHLVIAWLAGGETIDGDEQKLGADMMIIRRNQDPAEQLKFDPTTRQLFDVGTAYAVITFDKYFLNNKDKITGNALAQADEKSENERKFYWISFPFDVKLSDVFGFGEYGDQWIMQYYDGAARAQNGYWIDSPTFWKYITNKNYVLKAGQGYVLCLNLNKMGFTSTVFANTTEVSLYFPSASPLNVITGELPTAVTVPAHECTIERDNRNIYDSNWNLIGVPGFADISDVTIGDSHHKDYNEEIQAVCVSFYYKYLPATNKYDATNKTGDFQTMFAYMVQFAGTINWQAKTMPAQLAARRTGSMPSQYDLRLELAQGEETDQTFVQLKEEDATAEFDMNVDMTKIFNSGMNIYTLTGSNAIQVAGNALPMAKATIPVGVVTATAGEYTFRMPDGTDGISVFLIDNQTGVQTNMLLDEYTITLDAGTCENRFYLAVDPDRTATSVENIGEEAKGEEAKGVEKFLIDGQLFIRTADGTFDAKGQRM